MPATGFWRSANVFLGKVLHLENIKTGITASTSSDQAGATALTSAVNVIGTCATAGDSVLLPIAYKGALVFVKNITANSADVFPRGTSTIDGGSASAAKAVAAGVGTIFLCTNVTAAGVATWVTF